MRLKIRGEVLTTDGAGALVASGIEEAAEAESVAAGDGGWPVESVHAHRTANILKLTLHYLIILSRDPTQTVGLSLPV